MPVGDPLSAYPAPQPLFEFATASRIIFGAGKVEMLPELAASFGQRVLIVTGGNPARVDPVIARVRDACAHVELFSVDREPDVTLVETGGALARDTRFDVVVGIGGGSVIDAAKAIAALATNPGQVLDYLEVVGRGKPLDVASLPCLAVPTTAGTGAEVTRNAVLAVPHAGVKASLRSASMLPEVALVDPSLTHVAPPSITAASGMDALTQVIEPFLCNRANPVIDALCRDAIPRCARALRTAYHNPGDAAARSDMALASLVGGIALANAGLGAVHGFAAPIGGGFPAPHGAVCAVLLPHVLRANLEALRLRAPAAPVLARWTELARLLTGRADAVGDDAATWCAALAHELAIPGLATYGISRAHLEDLATKAARASSMRANPVALTQAELVAILDAALE